MNKESIIKAFNKTKYKIGKYAPEILIGIGITEMAMTVALAVKATPKAVKLIDEAKAKKQRKLSSTIVSKIKLPIAFPVNSHR